MLEKSLHKLLSNYYLFYIPSYDYDRILKLKKKYIYIKGTISFISAGPPTLRGCAPPSYTIE
jgi:hypothetical protein